MLSKVWITSKRYYFDIKGALKVKEVFLLFFRPCLLYVVQDGRSSPTVTFEGFQSYKIDMNES